MRPQRIHPIQEQYCWGYEQCSANNDAADDIIRNPDVFLLNQHDLFAAEGGWNNIAFTVGLTGAAVLGLFATNGRLFSHFKHGQMNFSEWAMFGGATFGGVFVGTHVGVHAFGDVQRYNNHWMAYTLIKSQNRFEGRQILKNKPMFY